MGRRKNYERLKRNFIFVLIFPLFLFGGVYAEGKDKEEFSSLKCLFLELDGYTQVRYTRGEDDPDGFSIKRARVGLKGDILKHINYRLQIDTIKSPVLLDAQIEISFIPQAKLTFGQFKVPFSLENLTSSYALDTINRSQTVENLCPGRDIGAQGRDIGLTFSGEFSWIEYSLGIFNGSGINKKDINEKKDIVGRFVFEPANVISLGLSHYRGKYSPFFRFPPLDRERTGADVFFNRGQLSIKGEYIFAKDDQTKKYGWYVQGGFFIIPEKIQTIVKYDTFDENRDVREDRIDVITFGLNWFFSEKTKLQVNYEYHKEEANWTSKNVILAQFQAGF